MAFRRSRVRSPSAPPTYEDRDREHQLPNDSAKGRCSRPSSSLAVIGLAARFPRPQGWEIRSRSRAVSGIRHRGEVETLTWVLHSKKRRRRLRASRNPLPRSPAGETARGPVGLTLLETTEPAPGYPDMEILEENKRNKNDK